MDAGSGPTGRGKAARSRLHRRLLAGAAAAILVGGATSSVLGALAWRSAVKSQASRAFSSTASAAASALALSLQRDADLAATARTLVQTTPSVTNARFATWFRLLGTHETYPGSFGLLYVQAVPAAGLGGFARRVAVDPPLGISTTGPFRVEPPGAPSPYCLVRAGSLHVLASMHLQPEVLLALLSFVRPTLDFCELPIGAALREASRSGRPVAMTLSSVLTNLRPGPGIPAVPPGLSKAVAHDGLIAVVTPIRHAVPAGTGGRSRTAIDGWVISIYQVGSILAPILHDHRTMSAALSYANPNGSRLLLARVGPGTAGGQERVYPLSAAGRWSVRLSEPPTGIPAGSQAVAVLLGGLLVSLLLFLLIVVLTRSRARALQLVDTRTRELRHKALHDDLTDLPNRALIFDRAEQLLARARRDGTTVAALFVDLDGFKDVNDSLGHGAGDELLRQVALRFCRAVDPTDTVGRLGGDEFVVLVEARPGSAGAERVAEQLIAALHEPFRLTPHHHALTVASASIGIASTTTGGAEELLRDADIALYEAKATAPGRYVEFRPEMRALVARRLQLEVDLREAVRRHELFLAYQPIWSLDDRRVTGVEALLRWRHPTRGVVMPGEFVPTLEATGLIVQVGRDALFEACGQAAEWHRAGHPIAVSVNAAVQQLERDDFADVVRQALERSGLAPEALTIEITESSLMRNPEGTARRLARLRSLGIRLAIDDFGTGYSSLAYLQQLPVDLLKIDRAFVARMDTRDGAALVHTIVQLGEALGIQILAEGIETPVQLEQLRLERCRSGQGFLLAHPLEPSAMGELLEQGHDGTPWEAEAAHS